MATVARIESTLGFNDANFTRGIERAEKRAQTFSARVEKNFIGIFKRDPSQRAENAVTNLIGDISSGNTGRGLAEFAGRISGLGIVAGIGIGAAITVFQKFKGEIDETRKAGDALRAELRKPMSITTSLSVEGMDKALQSRQKLAEDLQEKSQKRFGSELAEMFQSMVAGPGITGKNIGADRLQNERDLNKTIVDNKTIMQAQADLAARLVSIKREEAFGDENVARIRKIQLDTDQARAALKTQGLTRKAFETADTALLANEELALKIENKRAATKKTSLETEEKMARLIKGGLKSEDQKKVRAGIELEVLNKEIAAEKDPGRKRVLELEKANRENELRSFGKPKGDDGFGSISRRNAEMNDPAVFGSLGYNAAQRGETSKEKSPTAEVVNEVKRVGDLIEKYWGN